jgi:hypothetical protein
MLLNSSSSKRLLERENSDLDTIVATAPIVIEDDDSDEEQIEMPHDRRIIQQQSVDSQSVEEVSIFKRVQPALH